MAKKRRKKRRIKNRQITFVLLGVIFAIIVILSNLINREVPNSLPQSADTEIIEEIIPGVTDQDSANVDTELVYAELEDVVDGDTLWVLIDGSRTKIRLLEIDTPESVHSDESKNNQYGVMASDYTKQLLSGVDHVYLEYGQQKTDKYGRTLAYVWLSNEVKTTEIEDMNQYMLNAMIVNNGYARVTSYNPNTKNNSTFTRMMQEAQDNRIGLWQYDEYWQIAGFEIPETEEQTEVSVSDDEETEETTEETETLE